MFSSYRNISKETYRAPLLLMDNLERCKIVLESVANLKIQRNSKIKSVLGNIMVFSNGKLLHKSKEVKGKEKFSFDESFIVDPREHKYLVVKLFLNSEPFVARAELQVGALSCSQCTTVQLTPSGFLMSITPSSSLSAAAIALPLCSGLRFH